MDLRATLVNAFLRCHARTGACGLASRGEVAARISVFVRTGIQRPAAKLAMAGEPHSRELLNIFYDLVEHRNDQRPSAEMTVQGKHKHAHRLVLIEIIEGPGVDVEEI